jgi:hypothetical protein
MSRTSRHSLILLSCLSIASALGCDGRGDDGGRANGFGEGSAAFTLDSGATVTSATYAINGPNGFSMTGTVTVGNMPNVPFSVTGLPVGTGYMVSMAAVASDGMTTCTGSATFNVTGGPMPAPVTVHLACGPGGTAAVTESTDVCPMLDGVDAGPASVLVGSSIALTAAAHDLDGGPGPITYAWTATGGSLTNASTANATFTCTAAGTFTATVAITDGNPACTDSLSVGVTCTVQQ